MKLEKAFLKSKVARRIFTLFILCALIPITAVSGISYFQVSAELKTQGTDQLHNSARIHGLSIYDRLLFLETNMNILLTVLKANASSARPQDIDIEKLIGAKALERFDALALAGRSGKIAPLYGEMDEFPFEQLKEPGEKTCIFFMEKPGRPSAVFLVMPVEPGLPETDLLLARLEIASLWGIGHENMLPHMTDLCIITQFRKVLVSSFPVTDTMLNNIMVRNEGKKSKFFQYKNEEKEYYVSFRPLFLQSGFDGPNIYVVLRRAQEEVTRPIDDFKTIFPLVVLLTIWVIVLLSLSFIRKSLTPLEALKKATQRLAKKDFKTPVIVQSNDEFEDLAGSFNQMSSQLERHFEAVLSRSELDRAVLSSLDMKTIVNTAMRQMYRFFSCDSISINVVMEKKPDTLHGYILIDPTVRKTKELYFNMSPEDLSDLEKNKTYIKITLPDRQPSYLPLNEMGNMKFFVVAPVFFGGRLRGNVAYGYKKERDFSDEELTQVRQVADQVSVALSNSSLVGALKKLNLGTLEALARTVDAKSAWTAGHSERVTHLALKIAQVMGWNKKQLESLERGAYLHDIGKIGIPLSILDKPGRLNDEEYEIIKDHPAIGARILEPIEAYSDVIPVVVEHHEKYDGTGYPKGLAGGNISLGARILAVADVYDAVVSDRPYRQGWIEEKAVNMISEQAGKHFDPKVVDAFLAAISKA